MTKVAVDITASSVSPETFGEIVSISACEILRSEEVGQIFHSFVKPERALAPLWERLLEIDNQTLDAAPHLSIVTRQLMAFIDGRDIVCMSDQIVPIFLNDALQKVGMAPLDPDKFICVYNLLPEHIFMSGLEAIDVYTEVASEANFSVPKHAVRVAQMYISILRKASEKQR